MIKSIHLTIPISLGGASLWVCPCVLELLVGGGPLNARPAPLLPCTWVPVGDEDSAPPASPLLLSCCSQELDTLESFLLTLWHLAYLVTMAVTSELKRASGWSGGRNTMCSVPTALDGLGVRRQGFRPAVSLELGNRTSPSEVCPVASEYSPTALWFKLASPLQRPLTIYWGCGRWIR